MCRVFELLDFPFRVSSAHTKKKESLNRSPHAFHCYPTPKSFLLKERKDTFWRAYLIIFSWKPRGGSALQISPSSTELRFVRTLSPYLCSPIERKSLVSAQQGRKKNIMKSQSRLLQHDPHLICGMSLWGVEHPELISWAKLTGFFFFFNFVHHLKREKSTQPDLTAQCALNSTAGQHYKHQLGASIICQN